ncbi:MFS transporter [Thiomicrorhabdus sp. Milos-T2]|uniref:MFS transporter n=1 Tax=Thiomicrorhabdus sp. Milos-T2 TaxID=90814 RepID=UPI0004945C84|nr:MFS transporter [Thiomicrorhabdus sp. Milos-T2]
MKDCSYQTAYKKLSLHYFLYFAVLGTTVPYMGLYLQSLSFSAIEIGQLLGIMMFTKVVAPNIWGWLADRSGRSIFWVRLATALAALASMGLIYFENYWAVFLTLMVFSFFWHSSLPQFESYTFQCLGDEKHRYGQIRLWGSIGFIAAVVAIGWQIEHFSVGLVPIDLVFILLIVWGSSYLVKDGKRIHEEGVSHDFMTILKRPEVASLLVVSFLVQLSHGAYYAFYTIQLSALGYDKTTISLLWALGVLAEIAVFFWMSQLFRNYAVRFLILVSIALTILRWLLIGNLADSVFWMLLAQLLHAASFGLFHAAAIYLIDTYFKGKNHGKGQAIFAASSHGLGGALGMLLAGYSWTAGGAEFAYGLSTIMAVFAFMIAWRWTK